MQSVILLLGAMLLVGQRPAARIPTPMRELGLESELCFFRYEDNGRVNIADAKVSLSNYQTVIVEGGQAACFYLLPGTYSFSITSSDPYSGAGGRQTWRSPTYKLAVGKGQGAIYEVYPNSKGAEYVPGWRAKLVRGDDR